MRDGQWRGLEAFLDHRERARAGQFKIEQDRRAFILAHALRRVAVSQALGAEPSALEFADEPGGRPVLLAPQLHRCFFSHSRSRRLVAVAVATQPIGIDVEALEGRAVDFEMLSRFVDLPQAGPRAAELGCDLTHPFFFYWTALEAFWKLRGTGLVTSNPRIRCKRDEAGHYQLCLEGKPSMEEAIRVVTFDAEPGHAVALAVKDSRNEGRVLEQAEISWRSAYQLVH